MALTFEDLTHLRQHHPSWRLLASSNAPLVAAFLHRLFVQANRREISEPNLIEALEDELFAIRDRLGPDAFPKPARAYLDDWADPRRGWLRKYYVTGSDETHFDLTPAAENAIGWLASLETPQFVGTESRLLTLFDLLRQISEGSETDAEQRIANLEARRAEIDREIAQIRSGDLPLLDDTAVRDRFLLFTSTARQLLSDFRQVEQNFRELDREVREKIARWEDSRGDLLDSVIGERDAIADSDQGRSFAAFWDFLMSSDRQQELSDLLQDVLALEPIALLDPPASTRRMHFDWLDAGEHAQRTVAQLSKQLRRFLDDQAWLENRRIMDLIHNIEVRALEVRDEPPTGPVTAVERPVANIKLPFERPLASAAPRTQLTDVDFDIDSDEEVDTTALFTQSVVDRAALVDRIRRRLQRNGQTTLGEVCSEHELERGLAELVTYVDLAHSTFPSAIDDDQIQQIRWEADANDSRQPLETDQPADTIIREAAVPRIVFLSELAELAELAESSESSESIEPAEPSKSVEVEGGTR